MHRARGRPPRRRPTINDVAAEAGVSRGTVSRALNGGHDVSTAALEAVREAVRKTGYVVNQHARSLVTQRSQSVAFVLGEPRERLFEDPSLNLLLHGCAERLAAHDITLLLTLAGSPADRRRVARYMMSGHVDGALLVSSRGGALPLDELRGCGVPVVLCGKPLGPERGVAYVAADERDGAYQMTTYLRSLGRQRIATITGPLDTSGGIERLAGYRAGLDEVDPRLIAHGDYTRDSGERAMAQLLAEVPDVDAVFAASDLMAAGAVAALERAGRRVPDDVAVGGFDNSGLAADARPGLTTVHQPYERMSHEMVRLLLGLIEGERPSAVIVPTELVLRESA